MINKLYILKSWKATAAIVLEDRVEIKLVLRRKCIFYCPVCRKRLIKHSIKTIYVQDLHIRNKKTILYVEVYQGRCPNCDHYHTRRPHICHPSFGYTIDLMDWISDELVYTPLRVLAKRYAISYKNIRNIDYEVLRRRLPKPNLDGVDALCVDEKYLGRAYGYVTLVINARTGEPLHMVRGRDSTCLDGFYNSLSESQKAAIKYLAIDRSGAYLRWGNRCFPGIKVCYDAFHLVCNMNDVLEGVIDDEMKKASEALRSFMKGKRKRMLMGEENLSEKEREELKLLYSLSKPTYEAYRRKEEFRKIFKSKDENEALLRLIRWKKNCAKSGVKRLERFAIGIGRKTNGVINGIRYKINSAKIESTNALIERIESKACGLSDVDYLFLKLRQIYLRKEEGKKGL